MILIIASCKVTSRVNGADGNLQPRHYFLHWACARMGVVSGFEMGVNIVIERARRQARA